MTSIERTAYPRFKRLITARELHLFFSPGLEEAQWAAERTESDEHQLALLLMLKSYQRTGCFPKLGEVPDMVVDFARRALNLPEGTRAAHASGRSAEQHRALVRQRVAVRYDAARARELARETIRAEAGSKNNPADLINVALEKLVEAGLELPAYSTLDHMASTVRAEVNTAICAGIWERTSEAERSGLLSLLDVEDLGPGGKSLFNRLKQPAQRATWSHFRNQKNHLEWVDGLGDTGAWLTGVAPGKVTDFAGEAAAADAGVLRDYALAKRVALIACLAHEARMRARDDLATMFCKRVAIKVKKARDELEEIRRHQQAIVEVLVGNYRTLLHLLGFELMPRIRNWKELNFYRPSKGTAYVHIDALFGEPGSNVIDWEIIEAHFKDLMRVAISVREGRLSSTLLLRRLRSGSRRNAHYTAFREVGRVVRTVQLLKYLTDPAMRRRVTAATNKVEAYNGFSEWVRFGNRGVLADNDPVEQEKA